MRFSTDEIAMWHAGTRGWFVLDRQTGGALDPSIWTTLPAGDWAHQQALDADGDGDTDLAHFDRTDGTWHVSLSTGTGFAAPQVWADLSSTSWQHALTGDVDGDGRGDLAMYHQGYGRWTVLTSTGTGFGKQVWAELATTSGWDHALPGDFTGDGRSDIAIYHSPTGRWRVLESTGSGFVNDLYAELATTDGWTHHQVGDLDADGDSDIAVFRTDTATWHLLAATSASSFTDTDWATLSGPTATWGTTATIGDLDGDGTDDLALQHQGLGRWWITTSATTPTSQARYDTHAAAHVQIVDLDGDGTDELATFNDRDGTWWQAPTTKTTQTRRRAHLPYGTVRYDDGLDTDIGFTGQRHDATTGLMYYQARYYDPTIGRFTQPDPIIPDITDPQSHNRYSYVNNNPLRYTDPTGHYYIEGTGPSTVPTTTGAHYPGMPRRAEQRYDTHDNGPYGRRPEPVYRRRPHAPSGPVSQAFQAVWGLAIELSPVGAITECVANPGVSWACGEAAFTIVPVGAVAGAVARGGAKVGRALGRLDDISDVARRTAPRGLPALRQAYVDDFAKLADEVAAWERAGASPEFIAREAWANRRALGIQYKDLTPADELARITARNIDRYGDPLGPTVDYLRNVQGKTWQEIIESSLRPGGKDLGY